MDEGEEEKEERVVGGKGFPPYAHYVRSFTLDGLRTRRARRRGCRTIMWRIYAVHTLMHCWL